jgi:hypothetical protein
MTALSLSTSSSETLCGIDLGDFTLKGVAHAVIPLEEGWKDIVVPCTGTKADFLNRIALEETIE